MMRIHRAAACAGAALAISSFVFSACYDPCSYPGESSASCGATVSTSTGDDCHGKCASMSTTCQSYACVAGACVAKAPEPSTTVCGEGGVCDGAGVCVACNLDSDCQETAASTEMRCHEHACFSCADGEQNGNETGLDCGGSCLACLGAPCSASDDCKSGACAKGVCALAEGAPCADDAACATGLCDAVSHKCAACVGNAQCASTQCSQGTCKAPNGAPCEDDVDCANGSCDPESKLCLKVEGGSCVYASECASGVCSATCSACLVDGDCLGTACDLATGTCALPQGAYCTPDVTPCDAGLACSGFPATCQ
jgi:hypothetical protein